MTGPDDTAMALAWLLGCAPDDPHAPANPPDARPLVGVLCDSEPRCLFGQVYETPLGLLFTGEQTIRVSVTEAGYPEDRRARASVLLTYPDGGPRDVWILPLSCRHGQAGGFEPGRHVEAVRRLAVARMSAPPETRPHQYIVTD